MATVGKIITCRAAVVWEYKQPVSIEKIQLLPPGQFEVRIKVVACGLCHTDLGFADGYKSSDPVPFVLGHEGAGIVESIGEGVTSVKPGDKVLTMFLPQCRKCDACKDNRDNICLDIGRKEKRNHPITRSLGYDGTPRFSCNGKTLYYSCGCSTFSEYMVIPENSCVKVDPRAPLEKVCIMSCGFTSGYGAAVNVVDIKPGDIAAVWGLGGVGLATVVGCKEKGAKQIIGIDLNPEKEAIAKKMGCTDFLCVKKIQGPIQDAVKKVANGGIHFAFVCVGNPSAMESAIYSTKTAGTCVLAGITSETATIKVKPLFLFPNRRIVGAVFGRYKIFEDLPKLVNRYLEGKLPVDDFITGYFKLEQINEAMDLMTQGKSLRSVIVM